MACIRTSSTCDGATAGRRCDMFGAEPVAAAPTVDVTVLHAKIGELTLANDSLAGALGKAGLLPSAKRRSTVLMRCRWLPRRDSSASAAAASTICPGAVSPTDLTIMRCIDELHLVYGCCPACFGRRAPRAVRRSRRKPTGTRRPASKRLVRITIDGPVSDRALNCFAALAMTSVPSGNGSGSFRAARWAFAQPCASAAAISVRVLAMP